MTPASDLAFMMSTLIPTLLLLALISLRKLSEVMESSSGRVPRNLRLVEDTSFEWALYAVTTLILCAAFTGILCYAVRSGNLIMGAAGGAVAALIARLPARLPIDPDDFKVSATMMLAPPLISAIVGMGLSQLYAPLGAY